MVVTFLDNFLLHVEVADGNEKNSQNLRRIDLLYGDMSVSQEQVYSHFIAKKTARRGDANAKAGEFSIAEIDSKLIRVFEMRMIDNICDKALIEYRPLKDVCRDLLNGPPQPPSNPPETPNLIHLIGEDQFFSRHFVDLTHRYSFALDGNIPF